MGKIALGKAALALACAGVFAACFAACSNRHATAPDGGPADSIPTADDGSAYRARLAQDAADFHASLSALDRIAGVMRAAADTGASALPAGLFRGYGAGPTAQGPLAGQPTTLAALIKGAASSRPARLGPAPHGRIALGKAAAGDIPWGDGDVPDVTFEGDTAWFNYGDSARGQVHWVHLYRDPDWGVLSVVRDSLSYRWPAPDSAPTLISSTTIMRPFYGGEFRLDLSDDDGDGILTSARPGAAVRVRKVWRTVAGDTVRKSVWNLDHGVASEGGGFNEGSPRAFTDTTWIRGKLMAWNAVRDGDGDGLALEAAAGRQAVVRSEAFLPTAEGQRIHTRIDAAAGPDGDWFSAADNPWYAYGRTVIGAGGDTLLRMEAGDADGDGFYFDPAGGANRAWETHRYPCGAGCADYRDSVVKALGDLADPEDDRIAYSLARTRWDDGSESLLRTAPEGGADFGAGDTAAAAETRAWPAGRGGNGPDTLARTFRLAVGVLGDGGDDRVFGTSVRSVYGAGFAWRETTESRRGTVLGYSALLSGGRRAAGAYDAAAGTFSDTVFLADGRRELHAGRYDGSDGSAEYEARREGRAAARVKVERDGEGFAITAVAGTDTARYAQRGDTTVWNHAYGEGSATYTALVADDGSYSLSLTALGGDGALRASGSFAFAADGTGSGRIRGAEGEGGGDFAIGADAMAVASSPRDRLAAKP